MSVLESAIKSVRESLTEDSSRKYLDELELYHKQFINGEISKEECIFMVTDTAERRIQRDKAVNEVACQYLLKIAEFILTTIV